MTRRELLRLAMAAAAAAGPAPISLPSDRGGGEVPGPRTTVVRHGGRPQFAIDGKPYAKPVFETYVPETRFLRHFAEAGTDVFSFSTNLGDGFSAPTWIGPDRWDFSTLDQVARRVLEANPRGRLLPRIYLTAPRWWVDANPEECQVLASGSRTYRTGAGHGRDGKAFPSIVSAKWRQETAAALGHLIGHMGESDYGAHLFGYMITGLMSEEWYHWSIHTNELSDYSPHALQAFREWLRIRYDTVEALRRAWSDRGVDFESARVPSQEARQHGRGRTFRDPAKEMPVIDWYLFYNDIVPETIDVFCRAAKEACGFKKVVGAFYCYMFEFEGDPEYGHNAMAKLLRSEHVDFAMVTASYFNRGLGAGADYARAPITSLGLHGKLWCHDNDTVSFRYDEMNRQRTDRETVARYRRELGVTETPEETIWQYRRGAGFVLGNGVYGSFFDLHGGYFDDPRLMAEVRRLNSVLDASKDHDCSSVAEILVVSDETSCSYATFENPFLLHTLRQTQVSLAKIGAPHDSILADDLDRIDLRPHRLVIFLNCFHLTSAQRETIRRKVLGDGRTVLWCYAPGYFDGPERSAQAMRELTGIRLMPSAKAEAVPTAIRLVAGSHPAVDEMLRGGAKTIGWPEARAAAIAVDDPSATALGTREGSTDVALALRAMPGWTSVYTLNPVLPAAFLRALARHAGVHLYNDRDDTLYASRSYLALAADRAGPRTIRLPRPADVGDPFTGERLWQAVTRFEIACREKETFLWRLT
jgi:beta-galactosidase